MPRARENPDDCPKLVCFEMDPIPGSAGPAEYAILVTVPDESRLTLWVSGARAGTLLLPPEAGELIAAQLGLRVRQ
jgi:hypothetical protein